MSLDNWKDFDYPDKEFYEEIINVCNKHNMILAAFVSYERAGDEVNETKSFQFIPKTDLQPQQSDDLTQVPNSEETAVND